MSDQTVSECVGVGGSFVGFVTRRNAAGPVATPKPPGTKRASRGWRIRNWLRMLAAGEHFVPLVARLARLIPGVMIGVAELRGHVTHADGSVTDYGLIGRHLVTTAGKNYLAACMDNTSEPEVLKYHGYGIGTTAAASGDTALQTEFTTEYAVNNTRPTGSQTHSTNTYTTAATFSPDSGGTLAVTEWGLLSQAATGGGTLFDHQVFSAVNLVATSDSLTTTYVLTFS